LPASIVFSVYLGLSSAWLSWQQSSLLQQVAEQKTEIGKALNTQDKFSIAQNELLALNGFLAQQQAKSLVWLTLSNVIEDVEIRTLRYINGRYIFIGRTHKKRKKTAELNAGDKSEKLIFKSTDFLEKLIKQKHVVDAKFDSAVRRSRSYESFTVSFLLETGVVNESNVNVSTNGGQ